MKFTFHQSEQSKQGKQSNSGEDQKGGFKTRYWLVIGPAMIILLLVGAITTGTVFAQSSGSSNSNTATPTTSTTTSSSSSSTSSSSTTTKSSSKFNVTNSFLNNLANALGVSPTALDGDLNTAAKNTIQQAVTAGKLTQAQATKLDQAIANGHLKDVLHMLGGRAWAQSQRQNWKGIGSDIATALGIQPSELSSELKSGKTLQQVITENGKTTQDVVNAVVAQRKTMLDAKVKANTLTQAQETKQLDNLKTQLTNAIETNQISGPFHLNIGGWMHGKNKNNTSPNSQPSTQQATPNA